MVTDLLWYLWHCSWQVSLIVAAVLLLRWLFAVRLGPRWTYVLWLPVLLRLMLPPVPMTWGFAFDPAAPASGLSTVALAESEPTDPVRTSGGTTGVRSSDPVESAASIIPATAAAETGPLAGGAVSGPEDVTALTPESASGMATMQAWSLPLFLVWLLGVAAVLVWQLHSWWRWTRWLRLAAPVTDPLIRSRFVELAQDLGLRRPPQLVMHPSIAGPCLGGLWRPVLVLPRELVTGSDARLTHVLAHELAHYKHRDTWANCLVIVLQAVHWFNPLVWVALRAFISDREAVRDAEAVASSGGDARAYGHSLLTLAGGPAPIAVPCWRAALTEDRGSLPRRIRMLTRSHSRFWAVALGPVFLFGLFWLGCTVAWAAEPAQEPVPGAEPAATGIKTTVIEDVEPWLAELRRRLGEKTITFAFKDVQLGEALAFLRQELDINILLMEDDRNLPPVNLTGRMRADVVFNWLAELTGLHWSSRDGVVVFANDQFQPSMSTIVYDVSPLLERARAFRQHRAETQGADEASEYLRDIIQTLVDPPSWEVAGARLGEFAELLPDQLLVRQRPEIHDQVLALLNKLATGRTSTPQPAWRQRLNARLDQKITVDLQELPLEEVVSFLVRNSDINIIVGPEVLMDKACPPITLIAKDITLRQALTWICRMSGTSFAPYDEAVFISREFPAPAVEIFDVGWLESDGPQAEELRELIQEHLQIDDAYVWAGFLFMPIQHERRPEVEALLDKLQPLYRARGGDQAEAEGLSIHQLRDLATERMLTGKELVDKATGMADSEARDELYRRAQAAFGDAMAYFEQLGDAERMVQANQLRYMCIKYRRARP